MDLKKNKITLIAIGDIGLCGENIEEKIKISGHDYIFKFVKSAFKNTDIVIGNLEIPFCKNYRGPFFSDGCEEFRCKPKNSVFLKKLGINILSLANNHILDCGYQGLKDTLKILDDAGIKYIGAGINLNEARKPTIINENNIKIGFLSYSRQDKHTAQDIKPGSAPLNLNIVKEDINKLKENVDFIIVSLHFGWMYLNYPIRKDRELAHNIIDLGANMIIGHHPHVFQGIEHYKKGVILYSLGNFIFDPYIGRVNLNYKIREQLESFIFKCTLNRNEIVSSELIPIHTNKNFRIQIAKGNKRKRILDKLNKLSSQLTNYEKLSKFRNIYYPIFKYKLKIFLALSKKQGFFKTLINEPPIKIQHMVNFLK